MAAAFAGWTALAGFVTYSYAGAAPTNSAPVVAAATPINQEALNRANQLSDAFAEVAERVSPSVVTIKVEAKQEMPDVFRFFGGRGGDGPQGSVKGSGSGVIVSPDGAILTNNHVVEHASRIEVVLRDGRSFKGKVAGTDPAVDLAVVKIEAKNLPAATFADSSKARVGEWVLAIGAPFGLDYTLTAGVLSAKGRSIQATEIEDYLQTDASINPGNSGGPLVNLQGAVLGINTVIIGGSGIGFAIPSNIARSVAEQLSTKGKVSRAWIGVSLQPMTQELAKSLGRADSRGALVASVVPKAPADKAGLKPGDVIESIDSQPMTDSHDVQRTVLLKPPGSKINLSVRRDDKVMNVALTTAERPKDLRAEGATGDDDDEQGGGQAQGGGLGLNLQELTPQIAQQLSYKGPGKVVIAGVRSGSPADRAGLTRGDIIVEADRRAVDKPADVAAAAKDGKVLLRVDGKTGSRFVVVSKEDD
ncbi:MAG TPA: trypsin-like peptidase domain-containing protein [Polyangiales bacterium]|nr:trypsin-like peptidase domain-containing protein [Polyangiales bacterium]